MDVLEAQIRPFLVDLLRKEEGQSLTSHAVDKEKIWKAKYSVRTKFLKNYFKKIDFVMMKVLKEMRIWKTKNFERW